MSQDPFASIAYDAPATAGASPTSNDPFAVIAYAPGTAPKPTMGVLRKPTQKERFEMTYPVGLKGEGMRENIHNIAQNVGVGMFKTLEHPVQTYEDIVASLIPKPIISALDQRWQRLHPNVPLRAESQRYEQSVNPIRSLYEMLAQRPGEQIPQAVGQGIVTGGMGDVLGALGKGTVEMGPVKATLQDLAGAGREPVELARQTREARVNALQERYNQRLDDVRKENDLKQKAAQAQTAAERREYIRQLNEHKQQKSIAETTSAAPEAITTRQEMVANTVRQNALNTFRSVKASLDARWGELRKTLGPVPIAKEPLAKAVQTAESKYLMGAPESITLFRQLTNQLAEQEGGGTALLERPQGGGAAGILTPQIGTIPWEQGRVFYTALGDKMFSGELPGNVRQAVGHVRDALDKELSNTAQRAGRGQDYSGVKEDWKQFKQDWDDMGNMAYAKSALGHSGSPLARLVRARTPDAALRALKDERLMSQLDRYRGFGADLEGPRHIVALETAKGRIGKVAVPKAPTEVERTIAKLRPEPREPKLPAKLTPEEIRRRKLLQFGARPARPWDLVNPAHVLIKSDAIREALAKHPRKEITP